MPNRYTRPVYGHGIPWWGFDLATAAGCFCFAWLAVSWTRWALVPLAVLLWGSFIEPRLLRVRRYEVGEGDRALKVAFLSDIHVGPYKGARWVRRLVRATNALAPDVVLLGGDFLHESAADLPKLAPFAGFRAPLGAFAILGNHDEYQASVEAKAWFEAHGPELLLNRSVRLAAPGGEVTLAGVDDDWYGETDLTEAFRGIPADVPLVALLHNPELAPPAAERLRGRSAPTVFLSGHTHAGQIRLPFLGSVMPLPHRLGRRFDRGVFRVGDAELVIGAGTGESGPRARLFCPPELLLVTVRF